MTTLLMALLLAAAPPIPPADVQQPVNAWVTAFNSQQTAFPSDAFTDDCTVVDEFPPFQWSGAGAVRTWYATLVGSSDPQRRKRFLASKQHLVLSPPHDIAVAKDKAYLVYDARLTWIEKGKQRAQHGVFTVVERKTRSGWRIASHSWAVMQ